MLHDMETMEEPMNGAAREGRTTLIEGRERRLSMRLHMGETYLIGSI